MDELLELALKRISDLEKRVEKYYELLNVKNELDFILKGSYVFASDIEAVLSGNYLMEGESSNEETDTDSSSESIVDINISQTDTTDSSTYVE